MKWKIISLLLAMLVFTSSARLATPDTFTRDDLIIPPSPERFTICYNGSCDEIAEVHLSKKQWQSIESIFRINNNAEQERENIRRAIAQMETIVGKKTGTHVDKAGVFDHLGEHGQLDCIDESTNTSFYLTMMINDGLIRWHSVEDRETRGYFLFGWPHTTAVIRETASQQQYAVDAWFLDNGEPPYILPLEKWDNGWKPENFQ